MKGWNHHNICSDRVQHYSITVGGVELAMWHNTESGRCGGRISHRGRLYDGIDLGVGLDHGRESLVDSAITMIQAEIHELETLTLRITQLL